MAATPKHATAIFRGRMRTFSKDLYVSDVDGALVNFATGSVASATSDTSWSPPEPVFMQDLAFESGLADTSRYELVVNGQSTGDVFDKNIHDDGIANRPNLMIGIGRASKIQMIQRA